MLLENQAFLTNIRRQFYVEENGSKKTYCSACTIPATLEHCESEKQAQDADATAGYGQDCQNRVFPLKKTKCVTGKRMQCRDQFVSRETQGKNFPTPSMTFIQPQLQISPTLLCIFRNRKIPEYSMEWLLLCVLKVEMSIIDKGALCKGFFSFFCPVNSVVLREVTFLPHVTKSIRSHPIVRTRFKHSAKKRL